MLLKVKMGPMLRLVAATVPRRAGGTRMEEPWSGLVSPPSRALGVLTEPKDPLPEGPLMLRPWFTY